MFRAQQSAFDDVVAKATDENLTAENWEYILDVCDRVSGEESGAKDAVASMIKRLAHRNANVQLYTLELANALSQNCGPKLHRELASRAFTDALLRLANDRNTHQQVKAKILERMSEWADMFKDPDLGIMKDQYWKLKSQNPNLHPPSAPTKSRLTDVDRQKEEEELQMALKLSIQDKASTPTPAQSNAPAQASSAGRARTESQSQAAAPAQPLASGTTAATVSRVRALFDFQATDPDELTFRKGDVIAVLESVFKDWWKGLLRGKTGIFPLNYVEKLADPTPEELQREAHMESEVFGEIKNVEKLLTLLSTSSSDLNVRDNEEITKLYHSTLAIRPKLIELIGKYSQRKDEFTQLNERFIKSCRDYESLLDASMSQPTQPYQYGQQRHGSQGGGYGGGYAPQAPPPQQGGPRYFSPQQEPQYPPHASSPTGYPPQGGRGGPAPFFVAPQHNPQYPQDQQGPPGPQGGYARRDSSSRIPSGQQQPPPVQTSSPPPHQYPPQSGHRPESTYANPQELATPSVYNSPITQRHDSASAPYSASVYSQEDTNTYPPAGTAQPPPSQQQYAAYVPPALQIQHPSQPPPAQQQQQPTYDAPPPPQAQAPYPIIGDARNSLPSQGQYKAYQRPSTAEGDRANAPSAPPGGAPQDFYRQSTAY